MLASMPHLRELDVSMSPQLIGTLVSPNVTDVFCGPFTQLKTLNLSDYTGNFLRTIANTEAMAHVHRRFPALSTVYSIPTRLPLLQPAITAASSTSHTTPPVQQTVVNITNDLWLSVWRAQISQAERFLALGDTPYHYGYAPNIDSHVGALRFTHADGDLVCNSLSLDSVFQAACCQPSLELASLLVRFKVVPISHTESMCCIDAYLHETAAIDPTMRCVCAYVCAQRWYSSWFASTTECSDAQRQRAISKRF
jgi:hypothetical protein